MHGIHHKRGLLRELNQEIMICLPSNLLEQVDEAVRGYRVVEPVCEGGHALLFDGAAALRLREELIEGYRRWLAQLAVGRM